MFVIALINARLHSIGGFNPEEGDFPPKSKWTLVDLSAIR